MRFIAGYQLEYSISSCTTLSLAAASITAATSSGCDINTTWHPLISVTLEPARFAKERSASGGIVSSCVATMNQLGLVLHAALLIGVPKVGMPLGTCESYMNAAFSSLSSAQ